MPLLPRSLAPRALSISCSSLSGVADTWRSLFSVAVVRHDSKHSRVPGRLVGVNRTAPVETRKALRREVNFGCPVEDCGVPYLEYHHFDPRFSERPHHDLPGMVALCPTHHGFADGGR
jgi:hypothetical protein